MVKVHNSVFEFNQGTHTEAWPERRHALNHTEFIGYTHFQTKALLLWLNMSLVGCQREEKSLLKWAESRLSFLPLIFLSFWVQCLPSKVSLFFYAVLCVWLLLIPFVSSAIAWHWDFGSGLQSHRSLRSLAARGALWNRESIFQCCIAKWYRQGETDRIKFSRGVTRGGQKYSTLWVKV